MPRQTTPNFFNESCSHDSPPCDKWHRTRLITIESVSDKIGLKRSAIYRLVSAGELPPPIKFGTSRRAAVRWIEGEIIDFVLRKAEERKSACSDECGKAKK